MMNRLKFLTCIVFLSVLISSCQVFPYAYDTTSEISADAVDLNATPQPTQTPALPTATLETIATEVFTATPEEPTPEPTVEPAPVYVFQEGSPSYLANFANPALGCDWMGVAGQVFDEDGVEVLDLFVIVGNTLNENAAELSSQTGTAAAYGPGGYEIKLSDAAEDTTQTFWIEVINPEGEILSDRLFFDTYADCEKNLILINFIQESASVKTVPMSEVTPTLEAYP